MRKLMFLVMMSLMTLNVAPAFAQEAQQEAYLCKLQAGNCLTRSEVVQRKMKKMEEDVQKGKKVYSAEDLQKIEDKLKEAEQMLDNLKAK